MTSIFNKPPVLVISNNLSTHTLSTHSALVATDTDALLPLLGKLHLEARNLALVEKVAHCKTFCTGKGRV